MIAKAMETHGETGGQVGNRKNKKNGRLEEGKRIKNAR